MSTSSTHTSSSIKTLSILVGAPVDQCYTYRYPAEYEDNDITVPVGAYCQVSLGHRKLCGVVWDTAPDHNIAPNKLKPVEAVFDIPPMPESIRNYIDWMAAYTMNRRGAILKMAITPHEALQQPKSQTGYSMATPTPTSSIKLTAKQQAVISILSRQSPMTASSIASQVGCSAGVIKNLAHKKIIKTTSLYTRPPCTKPDPDHTTRPLTDGQQPAAQDLATMVRDQKYQTCLLDGVTGSGKTEVYYEAVAQAIRMGKQSLIMMPEIALSQTFVNRFKDRFGCLPAIWHSGISAGKKKNTWRGVANGQTKIVIGARSALFLPFQNLGLVIVDEEHDPAYKQEETVLYNARDMAIMRAFKENIPAVLVSATPSLETIVNAWNGKYKHLILTSRFGPAQLPDIKLIDMRQDKPSSGHFISPSVLSALQETLNTGLQSLLFLNRRGYAPLTLCRSCGYRFECPRCTAWLVEHRSLHILTCHHCGYDIKMPQECPKCHDTDALVPCGPGVERILQELNTTIPNARISLLSSDSVSDHNDLQHKLSEIQHNAVDIIIGTQIIAKGHHFPKLACVGVIDADLGLSGGDLRAAERTYQLLHQVAGRAGRDKHKGAVYLQTYMPENPVMQTLASGNRDAFLEIEAQQRKSAHLPPYSRLAGIILSSLKDAELDQFCTDLLRALPKDITQSQSVQILGPAIAPIARIRGKHRRRFLIIANKNHPLQESIQHWMAQIKCPSHIKVQIDIDPQSFF